MVGFQGSLMSYFTEAIYFSSIILGSLYHGDHLSRAMYQRITEIEDLPQSFSLNRPLLSGEEGFTLIYVPHCICSSFSRVLTGQWLYGISGKFDVVFQAEIVVYLYFPRVH